MDYLRALILQHSLRVVRVGQFCFYRRFTDADQFFTGLIRKLYGHGILSFLLCALSIALSVASILIASYSVASSLYAISVVLTIVHFGGTSILSLHNI